MPKGIREYKYLNPYDEPNDCHKLMIAILLNISKAQRKLNVKRWRLRVNA